MNWMLYFVLWRGCIIGLLGFAITQLHGWTPAPLLIFALIAIAADSVAALWTLRRSKE